MLIGANDGVDIIYNSVSNLTTLRLVCFLMLTLDQMGTRINDLERNVTELMTQADASSVQ
uniref:Heat shock factor binding protein 1 n=1 Tax=Oreochromis niloticus TaxID=8128 RepID=A0A669EIH5_ORENI